MSKTGRPQAAWSCSALALAALLNGTGCLRFGYSQVDRKSGPAFDAGLDAGANHNPADASSQPDAQLTAAGGSGAVGGSHAAGAGGSRANAGSGGSKSGLDASIESVDAGDAAVADASAPHDAGTTDAAMAAAGSGGGGSGGTAAGGTGGGGAAGSTDTLFANCTVGVGGVKFCNGFEEQLPWVPPPSNTPYSYDKVMNGSYDRYTASPFYGTASAHVVTTGSDSTTSARIAYKTGSLTSGDLWLRYFYYLPNSVVVGPYFSAGVMSSLTSPFVGFSLLIKPTSLTLETALSTLNVPEVSTAFPRGRWVCVEHHVFLDSSNGYIEVLLDGVSTVKSSKGNSIPNGGFGVAEVGIHYVASGQQPVTVYVDNVVISTQRFGCN